MNATTQSNHFNLHVSGIGYLNRVRWVQPKQAGRKAQPFLACSISALRGSAESPDYTYLDLRVSGQEAAELVENCLPAVKDDRKVVISFKVGDIYPHLYERDVRKDGRKTGEKEMACLIKGRLLLINTITIDGERVYQRAQDEGRQPEADVQTPGDDGYVDTTEGHAHPDQESEEAAAARVQSPTVKERGPTVAAAPAPRQQPRDGFSRPRQGFCEAAVAN